MRWCNRENRRSGSVTNSHKQVTVCRRVDTFQCPSFRTPRPIWQAVPQLGGVQGRERQHHAHSATKYVRHIR